MHSNMTSMACDKVAAETIETLVDRLQTSTLLEDRRDACRALRSCARQYRVEVGAQAMEALLQTIRNDRHDLEMVNYCLDSLNYVISGEQADSPAATWLEKNQDPGRELSEIFLKRAENVAIIIETLSCEDFKTRWAITKLLCGLTRHKLETVQDKILSNPLSLTTLSQLVDEERDLIRNDALILFVYLTQANNNIQNVLAYENFFDKIIYIIEAEKYLDGTVAVTTDCLNIFLNLLQHNEHNRILFREGKHIEKLVPFFDCIRDIQWTYEKTACIVQVLQILDALVSPSKCPEHVRRCQEIMQSCGILDKLCELLSATYLPIGVLSEAINTASDIVKGHLGPMAATVVQTGSMMPIILLGMVKELCEDQEQRVSKLCEEQEQRVSKLCEDQEQRVSKLSEYINVLYEFLSSSSSTATAMATATPRQQ